MESAAARLIAVRSSTAALLEGLETERWSDADVGTPSLLPDWTRGHVLTHLARNADSVARTLSAGLAGEDAAPYPDGPEGREADIRAGAGRPMTEQLGDVREAADRLDRVFGALADADGWDLPCWEGRPAHHFLDARWREVEIHRVDVAGAYTAADWPPEFVAYLLPELLSTAADRLDRPVRIRTDAGVEWSGGAGDSEPVEVAGPDWAVALWLVGRPVGDELPDAPPVARWR